MSSSARFHIRNQTKYKQQVSLDPPGGSHHFQFMVEPNEVMALNQSSVPPGTKISVVPPPTTDLQWNTPILNGQVRGASITITLKSLARFRGEATSSSVWRILPFILLLLSTAIAVGEGGIKSNNYR